jgi:hypothetical protein
MAGHGQGGENVKIGKRKTYGRITDQHAKPLGGIKVELWDSDVDDDDRMGVTYTDGKGAFQFRYTGGWDLRVPGSTDFRPDIYITAGVRNANGDWCKVAKSKVYKNHKLRKDKKIDLTVPIAEKQAKHVPFDIQKFAFRFPNNFQITDILGSDHDFTGDLTMGLCGGMVAAALHRYRHGCAPPDPKLTATPHSGPLFDELLTRQIITLQEISRIWDYQRAPDLPHAHTVESLRQREKGQWLLLKSFIDRGKPAILCLIRAEGYLADIWSNHQVLAYGYEYEPTPRNLKVEVYDPNDPAGPNFLHLCLSGGRLGAYQTPSQPRTPRRISLPSATNW